MLSHKSGMSTVLGMLIFIGVLFTSIIPLFLYINDVNSLYDVTVAEMRRFDQERENEQLDVYAYPDSSNNLTIYIKNRYAMPVKIVRVWVNDTTPTLTDLPLRIEGVSSGIIEDIQIPSTGDFDVWVVTERGNVFASQTNTLHITESGWSGGNDPYSINILIEKPPGQRSYNVRVFMDPENPESSTIYLTEVSSVRTYILLWVPVGYEPNTYYVTVIRDEVTLKNEEAVNVGIQNPSPWIYITDN